VSEVVRLEPGRRRRSRPLLRTVIGDVLRRQRQGQGRTLADVARAARVSVPYLSEVERGRKEASSEVLAAVCGALRIELSDLLAEVGRNLAADHVPAQATIVRLTPDRVPAQATIVRLPDVRHRTDAATPVRRAGDVLLLAA
jgi:transcriptional regulator with XRE-family HTH domain